MSTIEVTTPRIHKPVALWRKVLAAVLDFFFSLYVAGYAIGYLTGNLTNDGFKLEGAPAMAVFALIAIYFVVFTRFLGGTLWQRLLGARGEITC
ncbi:MAG: hypothetical protein ACOY5F_11140 [Pseudomonadota bacterium]|jgi:hypothetical protein